MVFECLVFSGAPQGAALGKFILPCHSLRRHRVKARFAFAPESCTSAGAYFNLAGAADGMALPRPSSSFHDGESSTGIDCGSNLRGFEQPSWGCRCSRPACRKHISFCGRTKYPRLRNSLNCNVPRAGLHFLWLNLDAAEYGSPQGCESMVSIEPLGASLAMGTRGAPLIRQPPQPGAKAHW